MICEGDLQNYYKGNGTIISDNQESVYYVGLDNFLQLYAFDNGCNSRGIRSLRSLSGVQVMDDIPAPQLTAANSVFSLDNSFNVYPNPFSKYLKIKLNTIQADELRVVDMVGRILYRSKIDNTGQAVSIDTDKYPVGMYLVIILNNGEVVAKAKAVKL